MTQGKAAFALKSWDEKPYIEMDDGAKMTKSTITYTYTGDIEGESNLEYLMYYRADESGHVIGLERIVGKLAGKDGSFVIRHDGTFDQTGVHTTWEVIEGSGSGELVGLRGSGTLDLAGHMEQYPTDFTYELG
ncbi:DUF3224 domain-containing protein [Phototrophicus methaneseepsis]|uniref:DUF3224 domain-containing protein n=1 Tax=Phototrophicus methaneseepsis TaxID=2710758 RepID=A0A7S8E9G3_9CHLR|nr:DUF3224 domain-containing protein [Phototrophicus methaneseepsis]QPC82836.1 DUF3224 domain-containing protein [Phototrophicus methaneseepsis]